MNKQIYADNLILNDEFTDFFMVKSIAIRTGSNGKNYLDLTLGDKTGDVNAKKWDVQDDEANSLLLLKEGDIVKIKASVSEWNSIKQLRITRLRKATQEDQLEVKEFIKAAPENPTDMYSYISAKALDIKDEGLRNLCLNTLSENKEKLMYYPAASKNHHAEYAGLLYHTKRMLDMGLRACMVYTNLDKDWVACGVIMHDMEKLNEIEANELGVASGYSAKGKMLGHLVMGAIAMEERAKKAGLDEEKTMMLQHMILSHHYEPEFGSPVKPMFPEAELLHYLDMIDAKMFDFEAALSTTDPGSFSEKVRTLDGRMLYKPTFEK